MTTDKAPPRGPTDAEITAWRDLCKKVTGHDNAGTILLYADGSQQTVEEFIEYWRKVFPGAYVPPPAPAEAGGEDAGLIARIVIDAADQQTPYFCRDSLEKAAARLAAQAERVKELEREIFKWMEDHGAEFTRAVKAEAESAALRERIAALTAELHAIAIANPLTWEFDVRDQFQAWAQNRARAAIAARQPRDGDK